MQKIRVRIIKCCDGDFWYAGEIGNEYEVTSKIRRLPVDDFWVRIIPEERVI